MENLDVNVKVYTYRFFSVSMKKSIFDVLNTSVYKKECQWQQLVYNKKVAKFAIKIKSQISDGLI